MQSSKLMEFEDNMYGDVIPFGIEMVSGSSAYTLEREPKKRRVLLFFVREGSCSVTLGGKTVKMQPRNMIIIKEETHAKITTNDDSAWEFIFIELGGEVIKRLNLLDEVFTVKEELIAAVSDVFAYSGSVNEYIISCVFFTCAEIYNESQALADNSYTARVRDYIDKNYMKQISVEGIAEDIAVNRRYLSRVFKQNTGETIRQHIVEKRLSRARELLMRGYSVSEAAAEVGYNDVFNFSRMFSRKYGKSPSNYKKPKA